ncbi:MAG: Gfo/Idh/MocA family oxidoreductase [Clostridiales bacterium]|nr:Gfo/Idh/MocA family oxidoreductase [Clostridiales bacterium]
MKKTIRAAVVGLGRIGYYFHLPEIKKHEMFEACAVVDVSDERLKEAKDKFGTQGYKTMAEMISAEHPDLVVIASPTHLHKEHTIEAMASGCDVFLDKPMAKNYAEVLEMAEAAERFGKKLMIYQPHRGRPETHALRQIIKENIIGKIYMYKRANVNYLRRSDWQSLQKFGGGMLNNFGAHYVDQALYVLGGDSVAKVKEINCMRHKIASLGDADDVAKILLRTTEDITVDVEINMACAHQVEPFMLLGEHGSVLMRVKEDGSQVFEAKYFVPSELSELSLSESLAAADRKYSQDQPISWKTKEYPILPEYDANYYDYCYEYYGEDKAPFVPLSQTVELMRILEECKNISRCSYDSSIKI